jgi:secondary thiamine-phosphate synthase enzyme
MNAMNVLTERIALSTRGEGQMLDLTGTIAGMVERHGLAAGQALVFVPGATAGVTTIEFEPGLVQDFPALFERIAPRGARYRHDDTWHDGNGHSHVRASLLGPSLAIPVDDGRLVLGTWQQVVVVDFDNRPREREVVIQLSGMFGGT